MHFTPDARSRVMALCSPLPITHSREDVLPSSGQLDTGSGKSRVVSVKGFLHFKGAVGRHNWPSLELPLLKVTLGANDTILAPS